MLNILFQVLSGLLLVPGALAAPATGPTLGFVLIGDSTTNNGTAPPFNSEGWSNGFCASLADVPKDACVNAAHDGATTGSTIASGEFDAALAIVRSLVAEGRRTLVTLQFGTNDQKIAPPESMGANLTIMVDAIRAAKGEPVLVTALTRRNFLSDGTVDDEVEPWAEETLLIAQQEGTHSLDLHKTSIDYIATIGPDAAHRLNRLPADNTHLNANGTIVFGRMVAELMSASYPGIVGLVSNPALDFNITHGIPSF